MFNKLKKSICVFLVIVMSFSTIGGDLKTLSASQLFVNNDSEVKSEYNLIDEGLNFENQIIIDGTENINEDENLEDKNTDNERDLYHDNNLYYSHTFVS